MILSLEWKTNQSLTVCEFSLQAETCLNLATSAEELVSLYTISAVSLNPDPLDELTMKHIFFISSQGVPQKN